MDLIQTARYFDNQPFDLYTPNADPALPGTWEPEAIVGQMKLADRFISLYNISHRRRMIYVEPALIDQLTSPFLALRATGDPTVFMVLTPQNDLWKGVKYRTVVSIQESRGTALVKRQLDPESTALTTVETTFGDYELRTAKSNVNVEYVVEASFFLFLPGNAKIQANDIIEFADEGVSFLVLTPYYDSGLVMARAEKMDGSDVDGSTMMVSYSSMGDGVYDPSTQTVTYPNKLDLNIVARVKITGTGEASAPVVQQTLRLLIHESKVPPGFDPRVQDVVTAFGRQYVVADVKLSVSGVEWTLLARA